MSYVLTQGLCFRHVRISTWGGQLTFRQWGRPYCMGVEDPFDCTDNCSRTFLPRLSSKAAKRFADAAVMLQKLDQSQGACASLACSCLAVV